MSKRGWQYGAWAFGIIGLGLGLDLSWWRETLIATSIYSLAVAAALDHEAEEHK